MREGEESEWTFDLLPNVFKSAVFKPLCYTLVATSAIATLSQYSWRAQWVVSNSANLTLTTHWPTLIHSYNSNADPNWSLNRNSSIQKWFAQDLFFANSCFTRMFSSSRRPVSLRRVLRRAHLGWLLSRIQQESPSWTHRRWLIERTNLVLTIIIHFQWHLNVAKVCKPLEMNLL